MIRPLAIAAAIAIAAPAAAQPAPPAGFFIGARAGMFLFDSTVQAGSIKLVDQGGDAPAYALFAGYDHRFDSGFFLGAEALGGSSAGRSRLVLNGVDYTVSVPVYGEAVARVGWRTRGNAAFYARLGGIFAEVRDGPSRGWRGAPLVGIGAEVPFGPRWFARIDASWSDLSGLEIWQAGAGVGYRW